MQKIIFILITCLTIQNVIAQQAEDSLSKTHIIIKNDGSEYIGTIISQDAREVLIDTKKIGQIIIPKHEIKEIRELSSKEIKSSGEFAGRETFATRYFITTNGLPIEKGDSYIQWNLFGPDFQFGIGKNIGVGVMTSWLGVPIIGTAKYSRSITENFSAGVGILAGTGSWTWPDFALGLPFATFTYGNRQHNISLSGGYGAVTYNKNVYQNQYPYSSYEVRTTDGRYLFSVAGMTKIAPKFSLVFDSFIVSQGEYYTDYNEIYNPITGQNDRTEIRRRRNGMALLIPGIRWHLDSQRAFQFGFAGLHAGGEFIPVPIPMVQWYRKL
jgi:hypothetical protein